jgi:hypothetical protein
MYQGVAMSAQPLPKASGAMSETIDRSDLSAGVAGLAPLCLSRQVSANGVSAQAEDGQPAAFKLPEQVG